MLGGLIAGIGSLIGGAASTAVSLGGSILGGLSSAGGAALNLAGGAASTLASGAGTLASTAGSAIAGGANILGGVAKSTVGATQSLVDILSKEKLAKALGTAGGIYQLFNPPEQESIILPATSIPATSMTAAKIPTLATTPINNTLPNIMDQKSQAQPQGQIFTTAAPAAAEADNSIILILLAVGAVILVYFLSKK